MHGGTPLFEPRFGVEIGVTGRKLACIGVGEALVSGTKLLRPSASMFMAHRGGTP